LIPKKAAGYFVHQNEIQKFITDLRLYFLGFQVKHSLPKCLTGNMYPPQIADAKNNAVYATGSDKFLALLDSWSSTVIRDEKFI
jgi:hypothetical protein